MNKYTQAQGVIRRLLALTQQRAGHIRRFAAKAQATIEDVPPEVAALLEADEQFVQLAEQLTAARGLE